MSPPRTSIRLPHKMLARFPNGIPNNVSAMATNPTTDHPVGDDGYQSKESLPKEPSDYEHHRLEEAKVKAQAKQTPLGKHFQAQSRSHRHGECVHS
jgi:hypothetical protein